MRSIYATEQAARAQGFFFAVKQTLPRWEQMGYVMYATQEEAQAAGEAGVKRGECNTFEVVRSSL